MWWMGLWALWRGRLGLYNPSLSVSLYTPCLFLVFVYVVYVCMYYI